ncbi:MAG: polyketide synthase [Planctomycetes bacterium]|nr:polyketide synthase [Planctomycetota bacterium]
MGAREPIALTGMAGFFPGAEDLAAFWELLVAGESAVRPLPEEKCRPVPERERFGALLERPEIPPSRFGIPPVYRRSIPDHFLLALAAVESALSDSGLGAEELPRDRTSVICGTCFAPWRLHADTLRIEVSGLLHEAASGGTGANGDGKGGFDRILEIAGREADRRYGGSFNDKLYELAATLPGQIAVHLRLRGRAVSLEAADLTSFAALDAAMGDLSSGTADLAIVASAQLLDSPLVWRALEEKGLLASRLAPALSPEGDGIVPGEAVVAVVLERLADARAAGRRVRAVLSGLGLSHSSERGPFRYGGDAQARAEAVRAACDRAGVTPAALGFVECFGSGLAEETAREVEVLARLHAQAGAPIGSVPLGSVKELAGHSIAASGLASLVKVVLALERRTIPPSLGPIGDSLLAGTPFRAPLAPEPWPAGDRGEPRRAGISASGMGGGHAFLVVEEAPAAKNKSQSSDRALRQRVAVPIAIVGLAGRFSRAPDAARFWENISRGIDTLEPVPESVLPRGAHFDAAAFDPLRSYTDIGSRVDVPEPDATRFRLVPRRIEAMDRAQKLALVVAAEALEGVRVTRGRAAVFAGARIGPLAEREAGAALHLEEILELVRKAGEDAGLEDRRVRALVHRVRESAGRRFPAVGPYTLDAMLSSGVAAHISNALDLGAFPVAVDGACASSLAALDLACRGLARGEIDLAVAGGVDLGVNRYDLVLCSRMRLLSPTRIVPFGESADGFSIGEGAAFFVMRRLEDALSHGDPIRAIVRGVGCSSDARSLIAPDAEGQSLAMRRAFEEVDFGPEAVDFLEAHGTGTDLGDQVEAASIREVYGTPPRARPLHVGSVKSMIGHAMAAAGAAGLLKTVLALEARTIPPNANLPRLNPRLAFDRIPALVPAQAAPWPAPPGGPRRAAVSSFGTGGLNYHVLLEEGVGVARGV